MPSQPLKPARTKHAYHDATVLSLSWTKQDELAITFRLDTHWTPTSPPEVTVFFIGVQNRNEIEPAVAQLKPGDLSMIEGLFSRGTHEYDLQDIPIRCMSIYEA
jgi:hypothetical protein